MAYRIESETTTLTVDGSRTEIEVLFETDSEREAIAKWHALNNARKHESEPHVCLVDLDLSEVVYHSRDN